MNPDKYLERIKYAGKISPSLEVLIKLQEAHLMHVPFENLDIMRGIKIDLANTYHKIVIQKRGGFCYELNGLFYELLKRIGFNVKMVSARVYDTAKGYGAEFDHMAIIVETAEGRFLTDVGFGEFALHPLKKELNTEKHDPRGIFRMETFDENYTVVKKKSSEGEFIPEYIFSERERQLDEFNEMCIYHQTSNESHFTQKIVCSLPLREGRITLTGNILKINEKGIIKEIPLNGEEEKEQVLWNYFGIKL